jgi:SAM-dependent methyltransferase
MTNNLPEHEARLQKEIDWYGDAFDSKHLLNQWPFYSSKRNSSSYDVAKSALMREVRAHIPGPRRVLVAPCGIWRDLPFLKSAWPKAEFVGIDISPKAAESSNEETYVGDIRQMPFDEASFDVAVATLFFHHIADEGFTEYLRQYERVLRPGGALIAMEQSRFHPLFMITRPAMKIFGNITGQVDHEHPIFLNQLASDCKKVGFEKVYTFACSFGHNRVPIPVRSALNALLYPFRAAPIIKHFGWQVGMIATKMNN